MRATAVWPVPPRTKTLTLGIQCLGSASIFAWATFVLPVRSGEALQLLTGWLTALHLWVGAGALCRWALGSVEWLARPWAILAWTSGLASLAFLVANTLTALSLVNSYGALGWGLSAALVGITAIEWLLTLPIFLGWLRAFRQQFDGSR